MEDAMQTTAYPPEYDLEGEFPEAREFHLSEGACVYTANKHGHFFVIIDSRTMLDFLDEYDQALLAPEIVVVYEFETEVERSAYLKERKIYPRRSGHER